MNRLNVPPTKTSQLALRRDLALATEGFGLLDQKREILVMELMRLLGQVRLVQSKMLEAQRQAFASLRKAVVRNGYHRMRSIACGIQYEHRVRAESHIIAGVRVPRIVVTHEGFASQYGFAGTDSLVDQTTQDFLALMEVVGELAELENAVWLLARELRRTQRRVNALEQIFIPSFRDTLDYVSESLEGKELDSFFVMKMVKRRLTESRETGPESAEGTRAPTDSGSDAMTG